MPDQGDQSIKLIARVGVGCLVLSRDGRLLLQQRDDDCQRFPGCLCTFGGGLEEGETPIQALLRELNEELGAIVQTPDVVSLGMITEFSPNHRHTELLHTYFWHDKAGSITGCYEGTAKFYYSAEEVLQHPKLMDDVRWVLSECQLRGLLPVVRV